MWAQHFETLLRDVARRLRDCGERVHTPKVCHIIGTEVRQIISKTTQLVLAASASESREREPLALTPAQALLRKMVLDSVSSPHSRRNYAKALDDLFRFCASRPLSRELLIGVAIDARIFVPFFY
jgi:hypothetical protein